MKHWLLFSIYTLYSVYNCIAQSNSSDSLPYVIYSDDCCNTKIEQSYLRNCNGSSKFINRKSNLYFFEKINTHSIPSTFSTQDLTYVSPREWQKKPFLLNADLRTVAPIGGKWFGRFVIHLEPFFRVRIFRNDSSKGDLSSPVRTPSYMPGASIYFTLNGSKYSAPKLFNENNNTNFYLRVRAFHHSNGQNPNPQIDSLGTINLPSQPGYFNRYDGDFGINLHWEVGLGMIFKCRKSKLSNHLGDFIHKIKSDHLAFYNVFHERSLYLSFERPLFFLATTSELYNSADGGQVQSYIYGTDRINIKFSDIFGKCASDLVKHDNEWYTVQRPRFIERFRFIAEFSYITNRDWKRGPVTDLKNIGYLDQERFGLTLTTHLRIAGSTTSLFLQAGYYGSDIYNVYFQQSISFIRFGLGLGMFRNPERADLPVNSIKAN